jgi:hypothetical protein
MIETLLILLAAHLIGDFVLQTDWMVRNKRNFGILLGHAGIAAGVAALLLGSLSWAVLLLIFVSHLVMDTLRVYLLPDRLGVFIVDQLAHITVVCAIAAGFPKTAQNGLWMTNLPVDAQTWYLMVITLTAGVLLCVPAGGVLIGKMTAPLVKQIEKGASLQGLRQGGRYIGWLERSLVMMFLLIGEPHGIGFLVAAKSILRFGEIKDSEQRKTAEYIIIGTFLSFGWAMLISMLTLQVLRRLRG